MAKKKSSGMAMPTSMTDWELEEDLRCVARAKAVRDDPERMKKVKVLAKKKLEEYKRRKEEAQTLIDLAQGGDAD